MERTPTDSFTSESSVEDSTSKNKETVTKKKSLARVPLLAPATERPLSDRQEEPKKSLLDFVEHSKSDTAESSAEEAGLDTLSSEELRHVGQMIASEHLDTYESVEHDAPDVAFLERIQDGSDIETAFTDVASELGMTEDEIQAAIAESPAAIESEEAEGASTEVPQQAEYHDEDDEQTIDLRATVTSATHGSSGGGSGPPPSPPTSAAPEGGPAAGGNGGARSPLSQPALAPAPQHSGYNTAPNSVLRPTAEQSVNGRNRAGELVAVGIVGYLIGRRRGRINTEKQLLPVQKKLEKQVSTLEQNISHKEQQLIATKARLQERAQPVSRRSERAARPPTEQRMQRGRNESRIGLAKPVRAEQLAHMIIAAEAPRTIERRAAEAPKKPAQQMKAEQVKDLPRAELLELSQKIVIEGASLRQIYETRLIGEKQLRHLVSEHLQGKDIHASLQREIVERQIDFERDPMMRDRVHAELTKSGGLSDLLARAGVNDTQTDAQLERRIQKEVQRRAEAERKQHTQRIATDVAMVTAVVVLAVAVVILAFRG